jgi:membrane-bound ClpP family serine protease
MLGILLIVIAAVLFATGIWLTLVGITAAGIQCLVLGAMVIIGSVFERRYRNNQIPTGADWQASGERFVDPTSGKEVEVLYNPRTGERRYVER